MGESRGRFESFLVPLDAPGIEIQAVETLSGERTNVVFYDDVRVHDDYRLGPEGDGWAIVHGPLNVEHRMPEGGPRAVEEEPGEAGTDGVRERSASADRSTRQECSGFSLTVMA